MAGRAERRVRCAGLRCDRPANERVGRLWFCRGCAHWERRYREYDAEEYRAEIVALWAPRRAALGRPDPPGTAKTAGEEDAPRCLGTCLACERGLAPDNRVHWVDGRPYAHVRGPRLDIW